MACNLSVWFSVVFYVVNANSTDLFPWNNYLVNVDEVFARMVIILKSLCVKLHTSQ